MLYVMDYVGANKFAICDLITLFCNFKREHHLVNSCNKHLRLIGSKFCV